MESVCNIIYQRMRRDEIKQKLRVEEPIKIYIDEKDSDFSIYYKIEEIEKENKNTIISDCQKIDMKKIIKDVDVNKKKDYSNNIKEYYQCTKYTY